MDMTTFIEIEKNREVDPEEVRDLFRLVGWQDEALLTDYEICKAFNEGYCTVSARDELGKLIGIIRASFDGIYVVLWNLVVSPSYQGKGIAGRLLSQMTQEIKSKGHFAICALVKEKNINAYKRYSLLPVHELMIVSDYSKL
jgi:aralkylamine N-acetyltransferase